MSILIMSEVWKHAPVDQGDLLILLALSDWADDNGRCFPAVATIASKARMSRRNAQRCLEALEKNGLIRVETGAGPKGCNVYFVDIEGIRAAAKMAALAAAESASGDDKMSPPENGDDAGVRGDKFDSQGVTSATRGGDVGVTQTTIEPPENLYGAQERAREASDVSEGEGEEIDRSTIAGTADFEKRVMRFCNGRGFAFEAWPDWDTSSPGYIAKAFGKLSEEDRKAAERWRDAYLYDLKGRGKRPVPVAIFLRDRLWEGLDAGLLERFEKRVKAAADRPANFAPAYGPVHSAMLWRILGRGPDRPEIVTSGLWTASERRAAWPSLDGFLQVTQRNNGVMADADAQRLAGMMVFVPVESQALADWRAWMKAQGFPNLQVGERGTYLPRGGPEAIDEFWAATRNEAGK